MGCVSAHVAVTFTHTDAGHFSVFWDSQATSQFLRGGGGRVVRYPLMGLHELANVQATSPTLTGFVDDVNVTFAQAYTPFVKAMDNNTTPYHDHPFLLTYLLGRRTQKKFEHLVQCTDHLKDYHLLREMVSSPPALLDLSLSSRPEVYQR